ncbi:hypothetical protein BOTBODRAFT_172976 [Botryobasidium botryosum FD-172 SS1]|uniref:Uncharacterized protein n=1 Tax=Botryobasidium botryosum (strain FD-172 SS1) TaxID=930990 RepID=A0A067MY43_BOTB1|nr:hypothetical protein BOTBODRAFT_172976 [Botryobasidium botryosum FD-172 SS1]
MCPKSPVKEVLTAHKPSRLVVVEWFVYRLWLRHAAGAEPPFFYALASKQRLDCQPPLAPTGLRIGRPRLGRGKGSYKMGFVFALSSPSLHLTSASNQLHALLLHRPRANAASSTSPSPPSPHIAGFASRAPGGEHAYLARIVYLNTNRVARTSALPGGRLSRRREQSWHGSDEWPLLADDAWETFYIPVQRPHRSDTRQILRQAFYRFPVRYSTGAPSDTQKICSPSCNASASHADGTVTPPFRRGSHRSAYTALREKIKAITCTFTNPSRLGVTKDAGQSVARTLVPFCGL